MSITKKDFFRGYLFVCVIAIVLMYMILDVYESGANKFVIFTFIINGFVIFNSLVRFNKIGYSLLSTIDIFMFIFFFLAPLIQYFNNFFPWEEAFLINDKIVLKTNFSIFIYLLVYYFSYYLFYIKEKVSKENKKSIEFVNVRIVLNAGFIISILSGAYIVSITGFSNLFSRMTNNLGLGGTESLIVGNFLKGFSTTVLLMNIIYWKINKYFFSKFQLVTLSLLTLILNFPTGNPRFQVAVVYLSLLLSLKQKFESKNIFKYFVFIGLFIIFPLINIFRNNTWSDLATLNISLPNPTEDFLSGNYDAYSMLSRSVMYVENNGSTLGLQLLGSIFFFVPRTIWPTKPIGSGAFLATNARWSFTNVSMPYIGEGYINFGLIGILIFSMILAYITSKLDFRYESMIEGTMSKLTLISVVYPLLIGFIFFIMRGDLLSSLSFALGNGVMPIIVLLIIDRLLCIIKK